MKSAGFRSAMFLFPAVCLLVVCSSSCWHATDSEGSKEAKRSSPCDKRSEACAESRLSEIIADGGEVTFRRSVHHVQGEFAYLEVTVSYPKQLSDKFAILPTGERVSPQVARRKFNEHHTKRWGALSKPAATWVWEHLGEGVNAPFGLWYDPEAISADELRNEVLANLEPEVFDAEPYVASFDATAKEAKSIAMVDGIEIIDRESQTSRQLYSRGETGADYTQSDFLYNGAGIHASGRRIGILENIGQGCGIWDEHEAFDFANVHYQHPPPSTCDPYDDKKCTDHNNDSFDKEGTYVRSGKCVNEHTTQVASRISSSQNGVRKHAAEADLYIANQGEPSSIASYVAAVSWLISNDVHIVNESWGGGMDSYSAVDRARDYYARTEGMTFVKAAGDGGGNCKDNPDYFNCFHECQSKNALCVGATSRGPWWEDVTDYTNDFVDWTAYLNYQDSDTERPDVVSEGVQAYVADVVDSTGLNWVQEDGTSLAAPVIAGLLALNLADCGQVQRSAASLRSTMLTTAMAQQELEPAGFPIYPINGDSMDHRAGAGIPTALHTITGPTCGGGGGGGGSTGEVGGDADSQNWQPVPSWALGDPRNQNGIQRHSLKPESRAQKLSKAGRDITQIGGWGSISAGTTIRATLSFYTCPDNDFVNGPSLLPPERDFDLALVDPTTGDVLDFSESVDDTNEGLQYNLTTTRDLVLWLIQPHNPTTSCSTPNWGNQYQVTWRFE